MRNDAREAVFKLFYAKNFTDVIDDDLKSRLYEECSLNGEEVKFADRLISAINDNYEALTKIISDLAVNYMLERIYVTDRCALLIGLCEMTYFDDVPNIVAINEALALCKKYSTEKSLGFVNGIFAKYKTMIEGA